MKTNPIFARKSLGVIAILSGIGLLGIAIIPPLLQLLANPHREASDYFFILVMVPLVALPGALALVAGMCLYQAFNESAVKCIVGTVAVLGAVKVSQLLQSAFPHQIAHETGLWLYVLIGTLVVIPIYLIVTRTLLVAFGHEKSKLTDLLGKGVFALIAWQVWLLLSNVFRDYAPESWQTPGLLIPIIVAYGGYKLAVKLLPPTVPKQAATSSFPPAA